jgi:hypothetical protein
LSFPDPLTLLIGAGGSAHTLPRVGQSERESKYRDVHSDGTSDTLILGTQDIPKSARKRTVARITRESFVDNVLFSGQANLLSWSATITTDFPRVVAPQSVLDLVVGLSLWYIEADASTHLRAMRHLRGET